MEGDRYMRKKALAQYYKAQDPRRLGRGSIFGNAANTPAPNYYSQKSASQEIKIKPNQNKFSNSSVLMSRQSGTLEDRSQFLYTKHMSEY